MQIREKPPVVVAPEVESFLTGYMAELCDVVVDQARETAKALDVNIDRILIRKLYYPYEDDDNRLVFEISVSGDKSKTEAFWDAVVGNISGCRARMSEQACLAFDEAASVFVNW